MATLSIVEFHRQVNIAINYLQTRQDYLKTPPTLYGRLATNLPIFNDLFDKTRSPDTETPTLFSRLHGLEKTFGADYREMQQFVKHSGKELTEEDYFKLFINKTPTSHHAKPRPTQLPLVIITQVLAEKVFLEIGEDKSPDVIRKKLPEDVDFINIFTAFTNIGESIPTEKDYHLYVTESNSTIALGFEAKYINMIVYIKATFGNNSGISLPSIPVHTVILG